MCSPKVGSTRKIFFTPGITWKIHIFPFFTWKYLEFFSIISFFTSKCVLVLRAALWKYRENQKNHLDYTWKMVIKICWPPCATVSRRICNTVGPCCPILSFHGVFPFPNHWWYLSFVSCSSVWHVGTAMLNKFFPHTFLNPPVMVSSHSSGLRQKNPSGFWFSASFILIFWNLIHYFFVNSTHSLPDNFFSFLCMFM